MPHILKGGRTPFINSHEIPRPRTFDILSRTRSEIELLGLLSEWIFEKNKQVGFDAAAQGPDSLFYRTKKALGEV